MLEKIFEHQTNFQIETSFGQSVHFFNIYIENRHGHLYTSMHHDQNNQLYTLSYVVGHAKLIYSHYFRLTLIHAALTCTNLDDFDHERLYQEITYLANGFPLEIIQRYIEHFFHEFKCPTLQKNLDPCVYQQLRTEIFRFIDQQQILIKENQQLKINQKYFRLYYFYEYGPRRQFNKQFQQLWTRYINKYPMLSSNEKKVKISLNTKSIYSLNALLAQEKPLAIVSKKQNLFSVVSFLRMKP